MWKIIDCSIWENKWNNFFNKKKRKKKKLTKNKHKNGNIINKVQISDNNFIVNVVVIYYNLLRYIISVTLLNFFHC